MLGSSISLTTARLLHYSQKNDLDFEFVKLEAVKEDFLKTIKRLGNYNLYKTYQKIIPTISTKDQLLTEIDKLKQTLVQKGIDSKKIDLYSAYAKRTLDATKQSCKQDHQYLTNDFDMITPNNESKMSTTIQKFDEDGNTLPLFKTNQDHKPETFIDEKGNSRYAINQNLIDWSDSESIYRFANMNNLKIHGHTILWHEAVPYQIQELAKSDLPPDMKKKLTSDFLYGYMQSYAQNVKSNGAKLESLDVLNEIANDDENSKDYLRKSIWRDLMGDDYYIEVLKMARQIFPDTKLMYNDFNEFSPSKRANMIKIIQHVKDAEKTEGVQLLDAIGLQCHLYGNELDYATGFKEFAEATSQGPYKQEIRITEIDSAPCGNENWQQKQMREVIKAADENGVKHVSCWNFMEQFSDSFEDSANSGFVDKNGKKHELYDQTLNKHSQKTASASTQSSFGM